VSGVTYTALSEGAHTLQVRAKDTAGNVDQTPASFNWTIDLTAPTATIDSHLPALTNNGAASFTFHASEPSSTLSCQVDSGPAADCTAGGVSYSVGAGQHTFTVTATDQAGNLDPAPPSFTWTVDETAPDTTIDSHPSALTTSNSPSFTFHASEGSTFVCQLDSQAPASCNGGTASYSGIGEGVHTFSVTATDLAGNADPTPATFTWTVDTTAPPTPSIVAMPANPTNRRAPASPSTTVKGA